MPSYGTDYSKVEKARKKAEKAGKAASERAGLATSFESKLRDRIRKQKVGEGASRLAEMAGSAWQEYSGAPANIQENYNLRPQDYTAAVSRRQAQSMGDIGRIAAMQQERQAGIGDIIAGVVSGIQAETQRQQALAQQAQQTYQNLLGEYQWGQEMELKREQLAQPTQQEQTLQTLEQIKAEAASGVELDPIMRKYSTQVDPNTILRIYNTNSIYGPAKESILQLAERYGIQPTGAMETQQELRSVVRGLESIKKRAQNISNIGDIGAYQAQRNSVGMWLARLVEQGRLSDQDRTFYLGQIPSAISFMARPNFSGRKLEQVIKDAQTKAGISGETSGEKWEVFQ